MTASDDEIKGRCTAIAAAVPVLMADLLIAAAAEEVGSPSDAEGARQAARSAIDMIQGHLDYFREEMRP